MEGSYHTAAFQKHEKQPGRSSSCKLLCVGEFLSRVYVVLSVVCKVLE